MAYIIENKMVDATVYKIALIDKYHVCVSTALFSSGNAGQEVFHGIKLKLNGRSRHQEKIEEGPNPSLLLCYS